MKDMRGQIGAMKQLEIKRSRKPLQPQAGVTKEGGVDSSAQRQSHLIEGKNPVGWSSWLELWKRHNHRRKGKNYPGLFLWPPKTPVTCFFIGGIPCEFRWRVRLDTVTCDAGRKGRSWNKSGRKYSPEQHSMDSLVPQGPHYALLSHIRPCSLIYITCDAWLL